MKRLLSGLLASLFLLVPTTALAAGTPTQLEAAQVLSALDVMTGDETGDLRLDDHVTRAEFTKLAVTASLFRNSVGAETTTAPYPDVPRTHWAAGHIQAAMLGGLVQGDLYGKFNPNNTITLAEGVTMLLRLLSYQNSDYTGAYPAGQMALYRALDLDDGVVANTANAPLTRGDALYLFYNLLTTKTKEGAIYLSYLKPDHQLINATGEIDQLALINSVMDGPVVAQGTAWQAKIPFDLSTATVYRGGQLSDLAAIGQNEVVYWSKSMRTLWVYYHKVSGPLQTITPVSVPTAVTVAGKTYDLETTAATYALSDLGRFRVGDQVTLLLGRDNKVTEVLPATTIMSEVYGMVMQVTAEPYTDAEGNSYTAATLHVAGTDGNTYTYRWDKQGIKSGNVVRVSTTNGTVNITSLSGGGRLSGKASSDGQQIDDKRMASDVEILDVYGNQAIRIYPARLAKITLESEDVRYCLYNEQGEISRLILKDVTGDLYQYGLLTEVRELSADMVSSGVYVYDVAGTAGTIQGNRIYNLRKEPFWMRQKDGTLDKILNLTKVELSDIEGNTGLSGSQKYTISDQVVVYEQLSGDRQFVTSLGALSNGNYTFTGWYDKPENIGGRIRVIIATAK